MENNSPGHETKVMPTDAVERLKAMVAVAQESARARLLDRSDIRKAVEVYEMARAFCKEHGLPETSIRVEMNGGLGRHGAESTFLAFDGKGWSAWRARGKGPDDDTCVKAWLHLRESQFPRSRAKTLRRTRAEGNAYNLFLYPREKADLDSGSRQKHSWISVDSVSRCENCGLETSYREIAPRAGGHAVRLAGKEVWIIVRRIPPCPTTSETPIEVGFAR